MSDDQQFYYDEFFNSVDGVDVAITIKGRQVPIKVRPLTFFDRYAAQALAVKKELDLATGRVKIISIDERLATLEAARLAVVSWPFRMPDGSAVPVNHDTLNRLGSNGLEQLMQQVDKVSNQQAEAQAPFVAPSDAASTDAAPEATPTSSQEPSASV